jgi:hypothetical protein
MRLFRASFVFALLLGVAPAIAHAQATAASGAAPAPAASAETPEPWSAKPVGSYHVTLANANPSGPMVADVTISEQDGKLTALFWPVGDQGGLPMSATVKGNELVLNTATPRGPFEARIQHHGAKLTGTWVFGFKNGKLEGEAKL